jgi:uncharacterized repeat protein (TIGR01451 family)/fimbrial isopeptide formation D2 family protein
MAHIFLRAHAVRLAGVRILPFLARLTLAFLLVSAGAGAAKAQDVDWVLNLNDTGFDPTPAGGTIVYTATITNNGSDPAPATTIDITVPANSTLTAAGGTITGCAPIPQAAGGTVTCPVPPLSPSGSANLTLDVLTTVAGTVTLNASVPTAGDTDPANNSQSQNTTVTAGADLELTVAGPATAAAGSAVSYVFTARNLGPNALTSATLQFPVPTGLTNITPPAGCTLSGATYSCTIPGPVAVGGTVDLSFAGQISAAGGSTVTPVASVLGGSPPDPVTANNTATLNTTVTSGSDLRIAKSRSPGGPLLVGDTVTFTLAASYTGDSPNDLTITDSVPANYAITGVTASPGWVCAVSGQDVSCTRASGAGPGSNVSLGSVTIDATVVSAGSPVNSATIGAAGSIDPDLSNNSATDGGATILEPTVDLRANKSGPNPALVVVGNSYDFTISATNLGTADFFGTLVMTDSLPAGLTLTGTTLNGWTCTPAPPVAGPAAIACERLYTAGAPLAAGATSPSVVLRTEATAAGTIVNSMTVSSPDANIPDTNPANDSTSVGVTGSIGGDSADISVLKTAALATVAAGEVQTFDIEIVNAGPQPSTGIVLTDALNGLINNGVGATGAGLVSVVQTPGIASGLSCSTASTGGTSRRLDCSIAALPVCTAGSNCPVVTVAVRPGGNGGARTNTATAISNDVADPDLGNNSGSAGFTVDPRADVTLTKVAAPDPAIAGQNLTYVLTARNLANGLSAASAVTVTDTLPADVTFVSASPSAGSCSAAPTPGTTTGPGNDTITCNLGTIANGAQRTLTVVVRPNTVTRGTTLTNAATVATSTTETDPGNNAASVSTPVQNPALDLQINKTDATDPFPVGDLETYTITVVNNGPSAAENVVITDTLPAAGLSFQSNTAPTGVGGACSTVPAPGSFGGTLVCGLPRLEAGASTTLTVVVRGETKGTFVNSVSVSSDEVAAGFDTDALNNTDGETTTVRTRSDVEVASKVASADPVNVRDDFDFVITVRNNPGAGRAEADDVTVSDTLPAGMQLTGTPTVIVTAGTATASTCTGAAGATSFTCDLGTFSLGTVAAITVPVEIVAVASLPQVFTNTATISTSSLDEVPANNTNSGTVSVNSSSIAGQVFRDFEADGGDTPGDTGIGGVTVTLTGTAFDGAPVSRTVTTAPDGTFTFDGLPQGDYTVTRGAPGEGFLTDGATTAGSAGGTVSSPTTISAVALPGNTAATGYLYPLVPQARIGIAKRVISGPTTGADGSFVVTFRNVVENFSLEPLDDIEVTDPLQGSSPLFGTLSTPAAPLTDPLVPGSYAITAAPSGTCGGTNGGFNGAGDTVLASGFTLAAGATCQVDVTIRVQPAAPLPPVLGSGGRYENQSAVDGRGALSGQTSATNPQLADLSDDGANPDSNGNGQGNEAGENDPTPVAPAILPGIALVKTADTSALSSPPAQGETITYRFAVTNTGNVTLTNVTLTDSLPGIVVSGGPIPSLAPGATDTTTFTATYVLLQTDVDLGSVTNQAEVTGDDPFGGSVSDLSGTTNGDDAPLVTPLVDLPSIALVKTATPAFSSPPALGDPITFAFTVTNTGNVTLTNVTVTDPLPGIVLSGGPIPSLAPGASDATTFTATYALTQADLDLGRVENQATATGTPPAGPDVTDLSGADAATDAPTVVPVTQAPAIALVKSVDASDFIDGPDPGDELRYAFEITNTGSVTLTDVTLADPLPGIVISGGPIPSLAPGASDTTTFTAIYTPTPADITAGRVTNTATVTGRYGPGGTLTVTDDSTVEANVLGIDAVPEVFPPFATDGGTTTSMLASDLAGGGTATLYTGGPVTPQDVTIRVISTSDPAVTLDPSTGLITLAPGNPAGDYTVTYEICSVQVPTVCDQATETVNQLPLPAIEATKTQVLTDNGDGVDGVGDTLTYTITVENTGNTPLSDVAVTDTLTTLAGDPLSLSSGPSFVSASAGSPEGSLAIGETATYTAAFVIDAAAANGGGTSNTVTADALPVFGAGVIGTPAPVTDMSDNGVDTDGNTTDDPTVYEIVPGVLPGTLFVEKTTPRAVVERGSVVPYTILVRNESSAPAGPLDIVDALPEGFLYVEGSATLDGTPASVTVSGRIVFWEDVTVPANGEVTARLSARVTQGADAGEHVNRASVRDPASGAALAPGATATVRILPEAVFDCGDVIGKVFDDRNGDGYQNDAGPPPIVADDVFTGKFGAAGPAVLPEGWGEPGIPAVRLAGVDGTIITTDEFGRFHVPCAMLPDDRGSNFILKVDTRSLPTGYRMTTENPRVVRLTPGKMTEMNFGATLTRVVRIDLNARAFARDGEGRAGLAPPLAAGIASLLPRIAAEPVTLRLAYHLPDAAGPEAVRDARQRMEMVERHIRREWQDVGRVKLTVEQTIVRTGE